MKKQRAGLNVFLKQETKSPDGLHLTFIITQLWIVHLALTVTLDL